MEFPCNYCKQPFKELRRCTGCYKVYYCSRECQVSDWKLDHKRICMSKETSSDTVESSNCATEYTKKKFHDEKKTEETQQKQDNKKKDKCAFCGKIGETKKCKNCMKVRYCSRECQKNDWKSHKSQCGKKSDSDTKFDFFGPPTDEEINFLKNLNHRDEAGLRLRYVTKPSMYKVAMDQAKKEYPLHKLVNKFRQVPKETSGFHSENTGIVLVAFICRFHPNGIRNCLYLQDIAKEETFIAFYFDNPSPYFDWSFATPARYIFIEDPVMHRFLDGTVGIRIDEAKKVKVVASDYLCYESCSLW